MFQVIGFDLDGTLADTIPLCVRAFQASVSPYAGHFLASEEILGCLGRSEAGMIQVLAGVRWRQALEAFYLEYTLLYNDRETEPFAGIPRLLRELRRRHTALVLITGQGERGCRIALEKLELTGLFDRLCWGSEAGPNKAGHIARLLGEYGVSSSRFCYVGDAPGDISACRRAGVTCLSAAWQEGAPRTVLERDNPGLVFGRVSDLADYLLPRAAAGDTCQNTRERV